MIQMVNKMLNYDGPFDKKIDGWYDEFVNEQFRNGYTVTFYLGHQKRQRYVTILKNVRDDEVSWRTKKQAPGQDPECDWNGLPEDCKEDGCNVGCPPVLGDAETVEEWREMMTERRQISEMKRRKTSKTRCVVC